VDVKVDGDVNLNVVGPLRKLAQGAQV